MARRKLTKEPAELIANGAPLFTDAESEKNLSFAASYSRKETLDSPIQSYPNIDTFLTPFRTTAGEAYIDSREQIRLCVKAYWAFPLLRNIVEVMGELANSSLLLRGSTKATRQFVEAWFEKVGIWQLKEQFFREWFRSGNCFVYSFSGKMNASDRKAMTQVFGAVGDEKNLIPLKYTILDPQSITAGNSLTFERPTYYKILNPYELDKLRNPKTPEEKAIVAQLDPESLKAIKDGSGTNLKLDPDHLNVLLYKAQPYEPMGVPMAYGVLKDIEAKLELKRIDLSIARTTDRALLLMTVGESPTQHHSKGSNFNPATLASLQSAFMNEGIARTLIADWTVKGEWLIPDINKILGQQKYEQIDKDIEQGLNAILFSEGEKFANTSIKVQVFVERLKEARNAFINNFLQNEVVKVCKAINAKNYPEVYFEDLSLKDELQYAKLAVQMAQLGFITPHELFQMMDNGRLPLNEESVDNQREFKALREEGLYLPIIGGATELQKGQLEAQNKQIEIQSRQVDNQFELGKQSNAIKAANPPKLGGPSGKSAGRPSGSKSPKSSSKPSPIGTSKASVEGHSLSKFRELFPAVSSLHNDVEKKLKKKYRSRSLSQEQSSLGSMIVQAIISNENQNEWLDKVDEYLETNKEMSFAAQAEVDDLRIRFNTDSYTAAILRLAKTSIPEHENENE